MPWRRNEKKKLINHTTQPKNVLHVYKIKPLKKMAQSKVCSLEPILIIVQQPGP